MSLVDNAKIEVGTPAGIRITAAPNSLRPIAAPPLVEERAESGFKLPPLTSYSDVFSGFKKPDDGLVCGHCGERCDSAFYQHNKVSFVCFGLALASMFYPLWFVFFFFFICFLTSDVGSVLSTYAKSVSRMETMGRTTLQMILS